MKFWNNRIGFFVDNQSWFVSPQDLENTTQVLVRQMNNEVKSGSQINDSKLNSIKSNTLYQLVCIQVKVIVIAILLTLYLQVQPTNITWYPMNIYLLVTLLLPLFSFSLYRISLQDNILHNVLTGNVFWRLLFSWKNSKARNIFPQFHQNGWDFFLKNNEGRIFIPLYFVDAFFYSNKKQ